MPCAYFVCCSASDGRSSKYWLFRSILHPGKSMGEWKGNGSTLSDSIATGAVRSLI